MPTHMVLCWTGITGMSALVPGSVRSAPMMDEDE
jgi:hypothetical protein